VLRLHFTKGEFVLNDVLNTIENRRSVRTFIARDVPQSNLQKVLQAANQAPSAHNRQSWRFVVVSGAKKQDLALLVSQRAGEFSKSFSVLFRMAARSISSAPIVIGVVNTGELVRHGTDLMGLDGNDAAADFFRTMEIQSSAAAVENLLLAATSLGISSVWLGVLYLIKDEVLDFLEEPGGEFMAVVPIGYTEKEKTMPAKKLLDAKVKYL
jgi:nitroreductase